MRHSKHPLAQILALPIVLLACGGCALLGQEPDAPGKPKAEPASPAVTVAVDARGQAVLHNRGENAISLFGYPDRQGGGTPFFSHERRVDGRWIAYQLGWCGTGAGRFTVAPGGTLRFAVIVPPARSGDDAPAADAWRLQIDYQCDDAQHSARSAAVLYADDEADSEAQSRSEQEGDSVNVEADEGDTAQE